MHNTTMTRAYALGLGYGSIWLVIACTGFGILDMININTNLVTVILAILGVLLIGGALLYLCINFLRRGYTLPKIEGGKISRRRRSIFLLLILLEIIGWTSVNITLAQTNHIVWIIPTDLSIIAAHFILLAYVFRVPAYLYMGVLWLCAIVSCMLAIPATTIIGHVSAWSTLPSICCIGITWLTVLYVLMQNRKHLDIIASLNV